MVNYQKRETHARVFSRTLAHWNSNIEKDNETEEEGKQKRVKMEIINVGKTSGT